MENDGGWHSVHLPTYIQEGYYGDFSIRGRRFLALFYLFTIKRESFPQLCIRTVECL